jgi:hypothetical protein
MRFSIVLPLLLLSVSAQAVTVTNDNRSVRVTASESDYGFYEERYYDSSGSQGVYWSGYASFDAYADQSSLPYGSLDGGLMGFEAQGSARSYTDGNYITVASSVFDVSFLMDQDMNLSLTGNLTEEDLDLGYDWIDGPGASLIIYEGTSQIYSAYSPHNALTSLSFDYLLEAGKEYRVRAFAGGSVYGGSATLTATYNIQGVMTATTVPVPAAVWLFGSALAGLGWLRRKQTV